MRSRLPSLLLAVALLAPVSLAAQARTAHEQRSEFVRLRSAAELEARGQPAEAERIVRDVLVANPTSLVALLALERLTLQQNRAAEVLPVAAAVLEHDPGSTVAHQVRIRTLQHLGRHDELERAAAAWIAAAPMLETPYREVARAWLQQHDGVRALRVLEQGRRRLGTPDALALELGEVHAHSGDYGRAAREWSGAIGTTGQGFAAVQRRLAQLPDAGAAVIAPLARALGAPPTTLARRRAAARLTLDAGLASEAEQLIPPLLHELPETEREPFLAEVARRADGAGLDRIAQWSYEQLLQVAERDTTRLLALRTRIAQLALEGGDTATAARVYDSLEQAGAPGSPQRRQAVAVRIELTAAERPAVELVAALDTFRTEYPDAPELPHLVAVVGAALLERRDLASAERVLTGAAGAPAALLRGRVFLRRGDITRARAELLLAAPALTGAEATRTLATVSALARMDATAGELMARALELADDDVAAGVNALIDGSEALAPRTQAAVLEFGAALADGAGLAEAAELARREIVSRHPGSDAAPAALLWVAQRAATRPEGRAEARALLERLILEHPRSALVPQARRALEQLPGGDVDDITEGQQGR